MPAASQLATQRDYEALLYAAREEIKKRNFYAKGSLFGDAFETVVVIAFEGPPEHSRRAVDMLLQDHAGDFRYWRETRYEQVLQSLACRFPHYRLEIMPHVRHAGRIKDVLVAHIASNPGDAFNIQQMALLSFVVLAGTKGIEIGDIAKTHRILSRQHQLLENMIDMPMGATPQEQRTMKKAMAAIARHQFSPKTSLETVIDTFNGAVVELQRSVPQIVGSVERFSGADVATSILRVAYRADL